MRIVRPMVVLGILLVSLVGCGGGSDAETTVSQRPQNPQESQPIRLTLEGHPNPENVGVIVADQRGYFEDEGLDVSVLSPITPLNVIGYVEGEIDEFGITDQPEVVIAGAERAPLVAVGSLVPRPTKAMIWLEKSGIEDVADLEGRTIATTGLSSEEGLLRSFLAEAGLSPGDVEVKRVGYGLVPALLDRRADALFGGSRNVEGVELEARGQKPVVVPVQDLGIPSYEELVVITRRDRLSRDPQSIRAFMSAVARGTAAAVEDPRAAAEAIAAAQAELGPSGRPKLEWIEDQVAATIPLLSTSGHMSPGRATRLVDWMHAEGMIRREAPPSALLTNRYVEPSP